MIKLAVCEDNLEHQKILKDHLNSIFDKVEIDFNVEFYNSGEELLDGYPKNIDIFILDIKMDQINGMDTAREIRKRDNQNVEIIFTTSVNEFLQEGYEVEAYRYMIKPLKEEELEKNILSCIEKINNKKENYIIFSGKTETYKILLDDILYIEVQKKNTTVHTSDKDLDIKISMNILEKDLYKYEFYRCHKSYLVNLDKVCKVKQYVAILENEIEVPISRYRFTEFKKTFLHRLGKFIY